jgi:hypothetical protein
MRAAVAAGPLVAAGAAAGVAIALPIPTVVVCGWCRRFGRAHAQARAPHSTHWRTMTHEDAALHTSDGTASHGMCPLCRPLALREWGCEEYVARPLTA